MKFKPKFLAKQNNGNLKIKEYKQFKKQLETFGDKSFFITLHKKTNSRSTKQNSFYWAYLTIVSEETGEDSNKLHYLFKQELLPPKFETVMGVEVELEKTTTKLNTQEFMDYMDRICAFTGIPVPNPDEYYV